VKSPFQGVGKEHGAGCPKSLRRTKDRSGIAGVLQAVQEDNKRRLGLQFIDLPARQSHQRDDAQAGFGRGDPRKHSLRDLVVGNSVDGFAAEGGFNPDAASKSLLQQMEPLHRAKPLFG